MWIRICYFTFSIKLRTMSSIPSCCCWIYNSRGFTIISKSTLSFPITISSTIVVVSSTTSVTISSTIVVISSVIFLIIIFLRIIFLIIIFLRIIFFASTSPSRRTICRTFIYPPFSNTCFSTIASRYFITFIVMILIWIKRFKFTIIFISSICFLTSTSPSIRTRLRTTTYPPVSSTFSAFICYYITFIVMIFI